MNRQVMEVHRAPRPRVGEDGVAEWLRRFARAVRDVNYDAGRRMFDPGAYSFGTVTRRNVDLDELVERQWRRIWGATFGFDFDYDSARCEVEGDLATAAVRWSSNGRKPDGRAFPRSGRATFIFRRHGEGWRAVHSHFSMDPDEPART